jgi:predicted ATPase
MKISISSTHGSGKTTLFESLRLIEEFSDFHFVGSPTRKAKNKDMPINNKASNYNNTQEFCFEYDINNLEEFKQYSVVFDRSLLDTYIYTKYLFSKGKVDRDIFHQIELGWLLYKEQYDLFIIPNHTEVLLQSDESRITDQEFQESIAELFEDELIGIPIYKVLRVQGTTQQRIEQIYQKINGK